MKAVYAINRLALDYSLPGGGAFDRTLIVVGDRLDDPETYPPGTPTVVLCTALEDGGLRVGALGIWINHLGGLIDIGSQTGQLALNRLYASSPFHEATQFNDIAGGDLAGFTIDWGDGSTADEIPLAAPAEWPLPTYTHAYDDPGEYDVTITPDFPNFALPYGPPTFSRALTIA